MIAFTSALVTGATGFIGSALTRRLAEEGIKVSCLVRRQSNAERLGPLPEVELIEVQSFRTSELQKALTGTIADVVFNLAASGVSQEDSDPEIMLEGNVNLVMNLLLAIRQWKIRQFVHAGSCSEYGLPMGREPLTEQHPLHPISLYGAAKAASVLYGSALSARFNIPFVTLRLFGVYGIGEGPRRLMPYIIDHLRRDEPVDVTPGEQVRDYLYIDDVVEAFLRAANSGDHRERPGIYNVCSGMPVSVRDVGETVAKAMDKPPQLLQWGKRPYRPDEPMWMVGDNRRFVEATGWSPGVSLSEGIGRMIRAARNGD